jgi:nucleoside-diphosphate-sugar epimerase
VKRVLVTGAAGFIGRHCLPLLADAYEVHAVTRNPAPLETEVVWHHVDLLDLEQARTLIRRVRPSYLLHLAWITQPGKYWTSVENLTWVQSSLALLQEFAAGGGERVVMAGTCAEYEWSEERGRLSEATTPLRPATLYGECKNALQGMLAAFAREAGLSSAWGRVFLLYGPGEHPSKLVGSVVKALLEARAAPCSRGEQRRDFLYVEDAAAAFVALLSSHVTGPVNVASGQPVAVKDVVLTVAELCGRRDLIQLGTLAERAEPAMLVADVGRLFDEVGWRPEFDLRSGLQATISWWREQRPSVN